MLPPPMDIILFGFKHVGKTFFGKQLASRRASPFIDTDDLIVAASPPCRSIKEVYQSLGAHAFRALEARIIQSLPAGNAVIALGAGAILNPASLRYLQNTCKLVYLAASFATLRDRILQRGLPAFVNPEDPVSSLQRLYDERLPLYEKIPALKIDTDLLSNEEILHTLVQYCYGI